MANKHHRDPKERLLESRQIDETTGCWLWTKSRGKKGYGQIWYNGKFVRVSRLAYEVFIGPIPEDRPCVLHKCDNPPCFNPDHLEAGTQSKNILDAVERGRWPASGARTKCRNGHEKGPGACKTCQKIQYEKWYAENREVILQQRKMRDRRKDARTPNKRHSQMV